MACYTAVLASKCHHCHRLFFGGEEDAVSCSGVEKGHNSSRGILGIYIPSIYNATCSASILHWQHQESPPPPLPSRVQKTTQTEWLNDLIYTAATTIQDFDPKWGKKEISHKLNYSCIFQTKVTEKVSCQLLNEANFGESKTKSHEIQKSVNAVVLHYFIHCDIMTMVKEKSSAHSYP